MPNDVIETLSLAIDVSIDGRSELKSFISDINSLSKSLKDLVPDLSQFAKSLADTVKVVNSKSFKKWKEEFDTSKAEAAVPIIIEPMISQMNLLKQSTAEWVQLLYEGSTIINNSGGTKSIPEGDSSKQSMVMHDSNFEPVSEELAVVKTSVEDLVSTEPEIDRYANVIYTDFEVIRKSCDEIGSSFNWSISLRNLIDSAKDSLKRLGDTFKSIGKTITGLFKRIGRIAMYRMIRAMLRSITEGISEGSKNLAKYSDSFNKVMSNISSYSLLFKNSVGTLTGNIVTYFEPVIVKILDYLSEFINKINETVAVLSKSKTWDKAILKMVDYREEIMKTTKSLMSFDEINKLNGDSGSDTSDMFETVQTDFGEDNISKIQAFVDGVKAIIGEALLVVGMLVCATGNIPLGVGLIIAGTKIQAKTLDWDGFAKDMSTHLENLILIEGLIAFALGTILALSGVAIGPGIALMAVGVAGMTLNVLDKWGIIGGTLEKEIGELLTFVGVIGFMIGVVLLISGASIGAGLGLMAANALIIFEEFKMSKDGLTADLEFQFFELGLFLSGFAVIIGMILLFTKTSFLVGVALIAGGAAEFFGVTAIALTSDAVKDAILSKVPEISNMFKTSGWLMIMAGLLVCMIPGGAGLPAGVALIVSGVVQCMSSIALDNGQGFFEYLGNILKEVANVFIDAYNSFVTKINKIGIIELPMVARFDVPEFETGGFPEDGLFFANHTELVGNFSNGKTAVANNQQITDGIAQASYEGMARALAENSSGGNYTFVAQLNGKTIFEEVVKQNTKDIRSFGVNRLVNV